MINITTTFSKGIFLLLQSISRSNPPPNAPGGHLGAWLKLKKVVPNRPLQKSHQWRSEFFHSAREFVQHFGAAWFRAGKIA